MLLDLDFLFIFFMIVNVEGMDPIKLATLWIHQGSLRSYVVDLEYLGVFGPMQKFNFIFPML